MADGPTFFAAVIAFCALCWLLANRIGNLGEIPWLESYPSFGAKIELYFIEEGAILERAVNNPLPLLEHLQIRGNFCYSL